MTVHIQAFLSLVAKVVSPVCGWDQGLSKAGNPPPVDHWIGEEQWLAGFPPPWADYCAVRWWRGP